MRKFYYELDEDGTYSVLEKDGGREHGEYYDTCVCWVTDEEGAQDLISMLHQIQETEES